MKRGVIPSWLLLFGCGVLFVSGETRDIYRKWMNHVGSVYFNHVFGNLTDEQHQLLRIDPTLTARIMGYSLSLQLKYIRRDSSEHRIWKELEEQSRRALVEEVKLAAQRALLDDNGWKNLESKILTEFAAATVGWHDSQMAALTHIHQLNAPNFFEILKQDRDAPPPPVRVDPVEPVGPGLPGDAILGKWTIYLTGREDIPGNKMSVAVRKADGADPAKYEAHYLELGDYLTRRGYQPGQPAWKVTFLRERQGKLDYEIWVHYRHDTGPADQRDAFRTPDVYTLDPNQPGFLLRGNRPIWLR